ncbi:UNC-50 [Trinorchestia longiramus]|nr:UNC-50 [Trinorchestia longiramus]
MSTSVSNTSKPPVRSPSVTSFTSSQSVPLSYRSGSALPTPVNHRQDCMTAAAKRYRFLRRIFKFRQMDFEFAAWQMLYLFISPRKVFRNFVYRKQTKSQFARDDPAFLILLCFWLGVTSLCFGVVLQLHISRVLLFLLYTVVVDTLLVGAIVATLLWFLVNHYLVKPTCFDQDVEWGYAFDVHLNAYFPPLLILHFFMILLYSTYFEGSSLASLLVGNSLWVLAIGYYIYITFLGYSSLPILRNTRVFFFAMPVVVVLYFLSVVLQWNLCHFIVNFYQNRVF